LRSLPDRTDRFACLQPKVEVKETVQLFRGRHETRRFQFAANARLFETGQKSLEVRKGILERLHSPSCPHTACRARAATIGIGAVAFLH
jgi:hypothetical protein